MEELTEVEREELKKALEARLEALRAELAEDRSSARADRAQHYDREVRDRGEESSDDAAGEVSAALTGQREVEARAVRMALARFAQGTYGECLRCGAPIGAARLEANPAAARCVTCQEAAERPAGS